MCILEDLPPADALLTNAWRTETHAVNHPEWPHMSPEQRVELLQRLVPGLVVTTDIEGALETLEEPFDKAMQNMTREELKAKASEPIPSFVFGGTNA